VGAGGLSDAQQTVKLQAAGRGGRAADNEFDSYMIKKPLPIRRIKVSTATAIGRKSSRADLDAGRVNQKLRTRDALVNVAAELVRRGEHFSVADVADLARVSRTTAYRYFATPELLRAQATLLAAGRIETGLLNQLARGVGSPEDKLDALIVGTHTMTAAHEVEFRSLLRLTLDSNLHTAHTVPGRPQFRQSWLSSALADLKHELGHNRFERLVAALSLMCGIESFVVLHDVLLLEPGEAKEVKRWAARLLLHAAVHEAADTRATQSKRERSSARRSK
jgi:AcrR family transcriptional regulator